MKLMASGVANCAAMTSLLVLAVGVVDDDDEAGRADVLDRLRDVRERRRSSRGGQSLERWPYPARDQAFDVLGRDVDLGG
jgi:hypothetical protein